ncbi:MAG: hypothetical protein IT385_21820 [Deltaproteobacteria bacterium]|nr:hypothetical protein [Deltaproteobacteria bacterium]
MRRSDRSNHLTAALVSVVVWACDASPEGPADVDADQPDATRELACELGYRVWPEVAFVPFADDPRATVVLGFQGFVVLELVVGVRGVAAADRATAVVSLALDGDPPAGLTQPDVGFTARSSTTDDAFVSDPLVLLLNPPVVSHFAGREVDLGARLELADAHCLARARVLLVEATPKEAR